MTLSRTPLRIRALSIFSFFPSDFPPLLIHFSFLRILGVVTYTSTHALDPSKPIDSSQPPITVQVVSLNWKWLFIYPEQHIASVNFLALPTDRSINFQITSDAPMNSFWIPQLSGQIYAMPGMSTPLHLNATAPGEYRGSSANLSGNGFSGMHFTTMGMSNSDFNGFITAANSSPNVLNAATYDQLAKDSENNPVTLYSKTTADLYDRIIMKYTMNMGTPTPPLTPGAE